MRKKLLCPLLAFGLICGTFLGCSKPAEETPSTSIPQTTAESTTEITESIQATTEATTAATTQVTEVTTIPMTTTAEQKNFTLDWKSLSLNALGETFLLYSGPVDYGSITWSSDDPAIATFNYGIVTATGHGTTKVHADFAGVRASCTVNCVIKDVSLPEDSGSSTGNRAEPAKAPPTYESVAPDFFADAVFVGDSTTEGLRNYCQVNGGLGDAKFLARVSYGIYNELHGGFHVIYNDVSTPLPDAIAGIGAKKVFIMLGINDIGASGVDNTLSDWPILLERIREKNSDVQIYIQSIHPVYSGGEYKGVNNDNVRAYNGRLRDLANTSNCKFIDVHQYMVDGSGGLADAYTTDRYVHLSDEGIRTWIKVIYAFAGL